MAFLLAAGVVVLALGGAETAPARGPEPRYDGILMLAGAGVANVIGLGLNVGYHLRVADGCDEECMYYVRGEQGFGATALVVNLAAAGLAGVGGLFLRMHDDWERGDGGMPRRITLPVAITGGILAGLGIAGTAASWSLLSRLHGTCPGNDPCHRDMFTAHVVGSQVSAHVLSAGAGMLAYGATQPSKRNEHSFHLAPMLGSNLGLSFGGRF